MVDAGHMFEYVSVAVNMVGSVFLAHRNIVGYRIFIAGFPASAGFAIYYGHWGMLGLYVYFFAVNCYGHYKWGNKR